MEEKEKKSAAEHSRQKVQKRTLIYILVAVGFAVAVVLSFALAGRWSTIFGWVGLGHFSQTAKDAPFSLHVLDVGKADAMVVSCHDKTIVIDGGTTDGGDTLTTYLQQMDISQIEPETLLSLYSIVFQDVTLFNNSIMENIRVGRKDATDEEVLAAAKLANCEEFARKLPEGWNTIIGENGCSLSGGERQRISIARAFLKNAPIILLDEATASLDVENETVIQTALSRLIQDKTVLVIAHRMRTVASADKIVVLEKGKVAEEGTSAQLLNINGIYHHMVTLQTESQNWTLE